MTVRHLIISLVVLLAALPVQAQTAVTVAVADFEDISLDSGVIPSDRMSEVLQALLQRQAGGRLRVISGEAVRAALRSRGYTPGDLVSPSRAAEVAGMVGANWLVTGRWTHLRVVSISVPEGPGTPPTRQGDAFAYAVIEIRVFDASARRVLFRDSFTGHANGGDYNSLLFAATEALYFAAIQITRL